MHPFTGPWRIVESLPGASYVIEFVNKPSQCDKKHAADLLPYLPELLPFEPRDSADSQYGQLHKPIGKSPYKEAGIEGFMPPRPFQIASHFATKGDAKIDAFQKYQYEVSTKKSACSRGLTTTNEFELCPATKLRSRRHYTMAPHPLAPCRACRPHHQSAHSLQAS
jgi:hypothetical protein